MLHRQRWEERRLIALAPIHPHWAESRTVKKIHLRCKGFSCPFAYDEGIRGCGGTDPLILSSVLHVLVALHPKSLWYPLKRRVGPRAGAQKYLQRPPRLYSPHPENRTLLGQYTANSSNFLTMFRNNLLVLCFQYILYCGNMGQGPTACPTPSVRNLHHSLCNNPEEQFSSTSQQKPGVHAQPTKQPLHQLSCPNTEMYLVQILMTVPVKFCHAFIILPDRTISQTISPDNEPFPAYHYPQHLITHKLYTSYATAGFLPPSISIEIAFNLNRQCQFTIAKILVL